MKESHTQMTNAPDGATEWCYRCDQYCGGKVTCDCCQLLPAPKQRLPRLEIDVVRNPKAAKKPD